MELKITWKNIGRALAVLVAGAFLVLICWMVQAAIQEGRAKVQIVPWTPAEGSSVTCYIALKGQRQVQAMSCLEVTPSE